MPEINADTLLRIGLFVVLAGVLVTLVLVPLLRRRAKGPKAPSGKDGKDGKSAKPRRGLIRMECPNCQNPVELTKKDLRTLSSSESGLIVSAYSSAHGRRLAEFTCPYCEAGLCFAVDGREPAFVGLNAYAPQERSNTCTNCHRPLRKPTWPVGEYDGKIDQAPGLTDEHGLECDRCGAACCVKCCREFTRHRTSDDSYLCPRCDRGPVIRFHHW